MRTGAIIAVAVACALAGCKSCESTSTSTSTSSSAGTSTTAPVASSQGRHHLPTGGALAPLFRVVQGLNLNDEQKATLDRAGNELRAAEKSSRDALDGGARGGLKLMEAELAAGVKAGKIDLAKLAAEQEQVEKAAKARRAREAEALTKVQRSLEKGQRESVVALVRQGEEKRMARMRAHDRRDGGKNDGGTVNWSRMRLESYIEDIGLDAEQKKRAQGFLPKDDTPDLREESTKQMQALLDAFGKDGFDATVFPVDDLKVRMVPLTDLIKFLAQTVPILKPEQRDKLAAKFEKGQTIDRPNRRHQRPHAPHTEDEDENAE